MALLAATGGNPALRLLPPSVRNAAAHVADEEFACTTSPRGGRRLGRLAWVRQNYIRAETLIRANARLVNAQADIPMAQIWALTGVGDQWNGKPG